MTLREWLLGASRALTAAGRDAPRRAAELLAGAILGLQPVDLIMHAQRQLAFDEQTSLNALLSRRLKGEPLAYILGVREFYGREFSVSPATLIPRPETEHLVETALECFQSTQDVRFADLGTGSGCIAITLAAERPLWRGVAVDIVPAALAVASRNAARHQVADRIACVRADIHTSIFRSESLDCIVSNPPYVSSGEYEQTSSEVRHEPPLALVPLTLTSGSPHGMESLDMLVREAGRVLKPGGWLIVEHGYSQAGRLKLCFLGNIWSETHVIRDLSGHDRVTCARKAVV